MGASEWVHLENCDVISETEMAIQIRYKGELIWMPRSQISEGDKYHKGDRDLTISVTEWIAGIKGVA
jgi:hypothetical protein